MKYQVKRTEKADNQLRDIVFYIADDSGSVDIALDYLDKIENAILKLPDFPYSGSEPKYAILRKQGYRGLSWKDILCFIRLMKLQEL